MRPSRLGLRGIIAGGVVVVIFFMCVDAPWMWDRCAGACGGRGDGGSGMWACGCGCGSHGAAKGFVGFGEGHDDG